MNILKPKFDAIPYSTGIRLDSFGDYSEEKMDGKFAVREIAGATIIGELMASGFFYGFDCLQVDSQDLRHLPLADRLQALDSINVLRPARGQGAEFLESVIQSGGEGVVIKDLSLPWGARWAKVKRSQVFYCRVLEIDLMRASVSLGDSETGEKRGKLAIRGKIDLVTIGDQLKVEGYGLTKKGLIREPRLDNDSPASWMVKG